MRGKIISLLAVFACVAVSISSVQAASRVDLGIKGGFGSTTLIGAPGTKSFFAPGGGGIFRVSPSSQFAIQTELLLSLKGSGMEGSDDKIKLTYIEVPILAMYSPPVNGSVSPVFFLGPSLGFLLSAKSADEDIKEFVNSTDLGFAFGIAVDFKIGSNSRITLDSRYTRGFSSMAKDSSGGALKNNLIFFSIGYLFGISQ